MAIISSVTFLLRLCLCTTDLQSEVECVGGKPKGLVGRPWLWPLSGFNCGVLMVCHPGSAFCLGTEVLCSQVRGASHPIPSSLCALCFSPSSPAFPAIGSRPHHRPQETQSPLRTQGKGESKQMEKMKGNNSARSHPGWGSRADNGCSHSQCSLHRETGRDSFRNYGSKCYFFS